MAIPAQPPRGRGPESGSAGAVILVVVLFLTFAAAIMRNAENPELVRIRLVAQQYGDAWRDGTLDGLEYDRLSAPDVSGDAAKVSDAVKAITRGLDDSGTLRPVSVQVAPSHDSVWFENDSHTIANVTVRVSWELQRTGLDQKGQPWNYDITLRERLDQGRWRVVWTPQTVHKDIQHGLVLSKDRGLAPRATVLGAGDTYLPPANKRTLAQAVLGAVVPKADSEQAKLAPLRAKPGDVVGVSGLQNQFDERLSGGAQIEVRAVRQQGFKGVAPVQSLLFVGPPETPKPLKLTLDARTQGWAETALAGVATPATLVVVKPSTGELLAVANTSATQDLGLSAQQPPGSLIGLASSLALLRNGYTLNSRLDCSTPWTYPGQGQIFRNSQGPGIPGVTLGAAVEGGCTTGIARSFAAAPPAELQKALFDLGLATPTTGTASDAPDVKFVGDQLGTDAFLGLAPTDHDPLHHAENLVGEGNVLVSPLAMARATATVATGVRQSVRLVVDPPAGAADVTKPLSAQEVASLRDIMSKAVTEEGGSAHALVKVGDLPNAMAGTAGYGTGQTATRTAWCTGYRGGYAFTVLITNAPAGQGAAGAVTVAGNFLALAR